MKQMILLALLFTLSAASFVRNSVWEHDGTLWGDVTERSPKKARGYNEVGLYYIEKHEYHRAFEPLLTSLRLNAYQEVIYINLGLAYEKTEQPERAEAAYRFAIGLNPADPTPYYNLGCLLYNKKDDSEKALSLFIKARDLNPYEPDVHHYLGLIYRDKGMIEQAQEEFARHAALK